MKLSIVIPVYNEQNNIPSLMETLDERLNSLTDTTVEVVFVDDGSTDNTLELLRSLSKSDQRVRVISFSRNFGSQAALMAGFKHSSGDAVAFISADLQEPPELLLSLLKKWKEGYQVVWATREQRGDSALGSTFSTMFWTLLRKLALPNAPIGGVDLCLADRKVVDVVLGMQEKNTALFGLFMWAGFKQAFVPYVRQARKHGKSKWTVSKKLKLFVDSFVSFSFFPIRLVSYVGLALSAMGFVYALIVIARRLLLSTPIEGWSSLMVAIVTLSGFQLLMLGIVAEYLWRTFDESRKRPPHIIKELIGFEQDSAVPNRRGS